MKDTTEDENPNPVMIMIPNNELSDLDKYKAILRSQGIIKSRSEIIRTAVLEYLSLFKQHHK